MIGYLPQRIFLSDNSIKFNIAYGQDEKNQDTNKLNYIFKNEIISNFVNNLPMKENTLIGEDGLKISGGQRQRIGISNFYKYSDIIILDEATSALDEESEKKILDFLFANFKEKTLILISHKRENLSRCNTILELVDRKFRVVKN